MRFSINARKMYPEVFFYIDWAVNSNNKKTKRKLLTKAEKELRRLSKLDLRYRLLKG